MADPGVLSTLLSTANRLGASPKERKALIEAGIVESGLRNLNYGDKDSLGVLQERTSIYGRQHALSPTASAERFLRAAKSANRPGLSAGALAQAVQRSAFPGRYDQVGSQAASLLGRDTSSGGGGGVGSGGLGVTVTPGSSQNAFDPGPESGTSLAGLLSQPQAPPVAIPVAPTPAFESPVIQPAPQGNGLADALASIRSGPQSLPETNTTPTKISVKGATAQTASLPVAHGKSKLLELFYNGPGGINAKNGQREPRGFVSGHTDHVHVAAGPKTVVALGDLAEQMGLHVGENPHFGGVHPVHVKNSNHYKGEAIDVSGTPAQMQAYNRKVAALYGLGR